VFKKPIISSKNKNSLFNHNYNKTIDINRDSILLDTECEEGHINNTNPFNAKSNFDVLKNANKNIFSKTNYCFYKNLIRLDEIKIFKSELNDDDEIYNNN
jgi:hypothetical protein